MAGAALAGATLAACSGGDGGTEVVRRDSAGVAIVENRAGADAAARRWRLSAEPRLEIGTVDGPRATRFHRVLDATRLPDGRIAVANTGTAEIRIFSADGDHLASYGGEGEGPEEFRAPFSADRLAPDTLLVWDGALRRITLLTPDGRFLSTSRHQAQLPNALYRGLLADRTFLVSGWYFEIPDAGFEASHHRVVRFDLDGQVVDSAGRYPGRRMGRMSGVDRVGSPAFSPRTLFAAAEGGFWVGTARDHRVAYHGPGGELERRVSWPGPDLAVTDELAEARRAERLEGLEGEELRRARRELDALPVAERRRAYEAMLTDDTGHLWVRGFDPPGSDAPHRWTVFDSTGRLVARAETPRRLTVHEIGADYVLGTGEDELGVERIRLYGLDRAGGSP